MAVFKCKMCGGALEIQPNATVVTCDYCGTQQTLPKLDDERRVNLYDRANHFRRNNDFDKAMGIYEQILNEEPTDAEAYWSLVLCKYGIVYVQDPATRKQVPTVNRAQFTSVIADENYKSALQYADELQKTLYQQEAKYIDEVQKGILAISQNEKPFDVFICYKETDNFGRRTHDSVLAQDLYYQLTQEGFNVFFSRITLEDKLGAAYEPYIFAALNSAKVMVVLGTQPEHFKAVWVKNEWSRYLALVKNSKGKKVLIPAYKDMDPYDLPEDFSHLQAQDMSKLGFMQDLIRGIKKIATQDTSAPATVAVKEPIFPIAPAVNIAPLLKRAFMFLEDGEFDRANDLCEQVLNQDPECADAYIGLALAANNNGIGAALFRDNNLQKAIKFKDNLINKDEYLQLLTMAIEFKRSGKLIIPDGIAFIPENAFSKCESLTSVTISSSVTSIGSSAFQACYNLTSITFAEGGKLTSIGANAFSYCHKLTSITLPSSVRNIGGCVFTGGGLTSVTFEEGSQLTSIGKEAFSKCTRLISVTLPSSLTYIGEGAFAECKSLTSITIPNNVTSIGKEAFNLCSALTDLTFAKGSSLTSIGEFAFFCCNIPTSLTIPNGVTSIGRHAFAHCKLTSMVIPGSVTYIDEYAFCYCTRLKSVKFEKGSQPIVIADNAFEKCPARKKVFSALKKVSRKKGKNPSQNAQGNNIIVNLLVGLSRIKIKKVLAIIAIFSILCLIAGSIYLHDPDYVYSLNTDGGLTFVRVRFNTTSYSITVPSEHKGIPVTRIKRLYKLLDTEGYAERIKIPSSVVVIEPGAVHWNTPDLEKVVFEDPNGWYVTKTKGATSGIDLTLTDPEQNAVYLGDTYREYYWYKTTN